MTLTGAIAKLVRDFGIDVYKDPRAIMRTPRDICPNDSFIHLGLAEQIKNVLSNECDLSVRQLILQIHIDGIPFFLIAEHVLDDLR